MNIIYFRTFCKFTGEIYLKWLQLRYQNLALTPEIISLLNILRQRYMLSLITNGPSRAQWEKIQRLQLQNHFDIILVSGDLPWEKPNQKIFIEACDYLGVEPHQCIMVGDKLETDILGGIQAKLGATVWIPLSNDNVDQTDLNPDHILENVTELLNLLPNNPKRPLFRKKTKMNTRFPTMPDLEDCNSNSSDGS